MSQDFCNCRHCQAEQREAEAAVPSRMSRGELLGQLRRALATIRADVRAHAGERTRPLHTGACILTWLELAGATAIELRALRDAITATEPARQDGRAGGDA